MTRRESAVADDASATIPFDDVERKLMETWRKSLGISSIGVDDDFFELGGNSLLAVAMISELNRGFGKKIPVSTLFRSRTIRQLAQRLREPSIPKSSFVPLVETGTKPPLFVAGWNYRFRDLSRALGNDQPFFQLDIFALQEERLIAKQPLLTTIEEIAAHFIGEIVAVQPSGPYYLAGQCEGSIVALEIARQLQRQGQRVETLMQFDTALTGDIRDTAFHRLVLESLRRNDAPQRALRFAKRLLRQFFSRTTATHDHIWTVIRDAISTYGSDKAFNGEIILIRADGLTDRTSGWERVGALRIFDVPGFHESFFGNHGAQAIIRGLLDDAQRQAGRPDQERRLLELDKR